MTAGRRRDYHPVVGVTIGLATVPAPWGPIHVAADSTSVVALEVATEEAPFLARLERRTGAGRAAVVATGPAAAMLDRAVAELEEYLAGRRRTFGIAPRMEFLGAWDRLVLDGVRGIPWGSVASYGGVATRIGRRGAARAAGGAIGRNPVGILIPCHRVIAADGTIGGYGGDWFGSRERLLGIKRDLLELEGIRLPVPRPLDTLAGPPWSEAGDRSAP